MKKFLVTDNHLQAFVDLELNNEAATRVWHSILDNPALGQRHEELIVQKRLLMRWGKTSGAEERRKTVHLVEPLETARAAL